MQRQSPPQSGAQRVWNHAASSSVDLLEWLPNARPAALLDMQSDKQTSSAQTSSAPVLVLQLFGLVIIRYGPRETTVCLLLVHDHMPLCQSLRATSDATTFEKRPRNGTTKRCRCAVGCGRDSRQLLHAGSGRRDAGRDRPVRVMGQPRRTRRA